MILDDIVADKRKELTQTKAEMSLGELEARIAQRVAPLDFAGALWSDGISIIAEIKKASPSKGRSESNRHQWTPWPPCQYHTLPANRPGHSDQP